MKVTVYNCREFDEKELFIKYAKEFGLELVLCPDAPDMENASLAEGSRCIDVITSLLPAELIKRFHESGVEYITTRTIGYDHIDVQAAKALGIKVANAPYGPCGVADYTLMLMLMSIRRMKRILQRGGIQDYTLAGLQGRELKDMTVGVVGTGRIGRTVIQALSGFGCRILAYDMYPCEKAAETAKYVDLDTLFRESDMITLHTPLTEETYHLINEDTIQKMKQGVILINTARGGLVDSQALIEGIESGRIGAAGLDVVENEFELYYYDRKSDVLDNRELSILRSFPNVTVSHHMAFYTDNYVDTVVRDSLLGCKLFEEGRENPWEV